MDNETQQPVRRGWVFPEFKHEKEDLPKGKLSLKFIQSRCVIQIYLSGKPIICACGETEEDAIKELRFYYNVDDARIAKMVEDGIGYCIK